MKTSTKVIIDKYAGGSIVFVLKNLFQLFNSKNTKKTFSPKTIVVCKFLGMGSIVQSTPLLQTFKKLFPEVKIIYLTSISNKNFLEQISLIDESIIINDKSFFSTIISTLSCIRILFAKKADLFIDLELYSHFSKIFTIVSDADLKFGLTHATDKNQNIYSSTFQMHTDRPVSESYLEMTKHFNPQEISRELYKFQVSNEKRNAVHKRFKISGEYIVVNPNASDLRIERRWPKENFISLINKIAEADPTRKIVLIGSSFESNYVNEIYSSINLSQHKSIINTAGMLLTDELIALISGTTLMITNDTGPMHLSFALNRPTLALFGPASPIQFGNHTNSTAVYKKVSCSPCVHDHIKPPCGGDNICMKGIDVAEVYLATIGLMKVKGQVSKVDL